MAPELLDSRGARPFAAPHAYYCDDDTFLRISVLGSGTQTIIVTGRFLTLDGEIKALDHRVVSTGSRTVPDTLIRALGYGWLLNITVISGAAVLGLAQKIVSVDLVRGPGGNGGTLATLIQGPVSSLQRQAWPGSLLTTSLDVAGILRSITGTDPAANTEISETVPTGARWKLRAIGVTLVTDANAANREVSIILDDGTTTLYEAASGFSHVASTTVRYSGAIIGALTAPAQAVRRQIILPDLWLPGGSRVRTVTTNIQVTDNYGAPQLLVEESLEGV